MTDTPDRETPEQPELPARKLNGRVIAIVAAIALLVLGGAAAGIYILTSGEDTPSAADTPAGSASATPTPGGTASGQPPAPPGSGAAPPAEVGGAKGVAEQAIKAINTHDPEAMRKVSCDPEAIGPAENTTPDTRAELVSDPELTGDTATVELKLTIGDQSTTTLLPLRKQNGTWCVD